MILNDDEIQQRIESPLNLLNRLRTTLNRVSSQLPNIPNSPQQSPCLPPKAEDLIDDLNGKLANTATKIKANSLLMKAMNELEPRLSEVQKPEALANIAFNMQRIIAAHEGVGRNQTERSAQIIVYAPQVQSLEKFEVIDIKE